MQDWIQLLVGGCFQKARYRQLCGKLKNPGRTRRGLNQLLYSGHVANLKGGANPSSVLMAWEGVSCWVANPSGQLSYRESDGTSCAPHRLRDSEPEGGNSTVTVTGVTGRVFDGVRASSIGLYLCNTFFCDILAR